MFRVSCWTNKQTNRDKTRLGSPLAGRFENPKQKPIIFDSQWANRFTVRRK